MCPVQVRIYIKFSFLQTFSLSDQTTINVLTELSPNIYFGLTYSVEIIFKKDESQPLFWSNKPKISFNVLQKRPTQVF